MGSLTDKAIGFILLTVGLAAFLYYTTWVLVIPFVESHQPIHNYFLPKEYAIKLPLALLLVGIVGLVSFVAFVMISNSIQKRAAAKEKKKSD